MKLNVVHTAVDPFDGTVREFKAEYDLEEHVPGSDYSHTAYSVFHGVRSQMGWMGKSLAALKADLLAQLIIRIRHNRELK